MVPSNCVTVLNIEGRTGLLHPVLINDGTYKILVDAGLPNQVDLIESELNRIDISLDALDYLIFTHQDIDHIGSANEIKKRAPKLKTMASVEEAPFIQGDRMPTKMAGLAQNIEALSTEQQQFYAFLASAYETSFIHVDQLLVDQERLPFAGGIDIIHTPGHTPGHICLYINELKILLCGDTLNVENGRLYGPNPIYTLDMPLAENSIRTLATFDINCIISYHGGVLHHGNNALKSLIDTF